MQLLSVFKNNIKNRTLFDIESKVLLAVSGGVDSMVMADLFKSSGYKFAVAHCNFQLRGEDADKDELLVESWCNINKVEYYYTKFDTEQKCKEWKKGIQETARILRYGWLESIREQIDAAYIATAHHANDNVETLLINLFKGTGISGLHGINPKSNSVIRPLLFAKKEDLLQYASKHNVEFRDDSSNATDKYLRNAIRLNVIPEVEKVIPTVVDNLTDTIGRLSEVEIIYNAAILKEKKKLIEKRGADYYIPIRKLLKRQALNTICYELCKPFGFTSAQVPQIIALCFSETGHYIDSPTNRIIKDRQFLIITDITPKNSDLIVIESLPYNVDVNNHSISIAETANTDINTSIDTACLDMAKIEFPLKLRTWRLGDYFYPLGMGMKKKKLSKYFKDQKIPLHEKDNIWILESNKRIVWVVGHRMDERFKITAGTTHVLEARITTRN